MLLSPWILICLDAPMSEKGDSKIFLPYPYKPQLGYSQKTVSVSLFPFLWGNNVHWAWRWGWILHHFRQCKPRLRGKTKIMVQSYLWLKNPWKTMVCVLLRDCIDRRWWDNNLVRVTTSESNCHWQEFLSQQVPGYHFHQKPASVLGHHQGWKQTQWGWLETLIRNIHRWYYESWILFMELNLDFELWHIFSMSIKLALTSMRKEGWHLIDLKQKAEIVMGSAWTLLCGWDGFASMLHYICHLISPPVVTVLVSLSLKEIIECDVNGSVR